MYRLISWKVQSIETHSRNNMFQNKMYLYSDTNISSYLNAKTHKCVFLDNCTENWQY